MRQEERINMTSAEFGWVAVAILALGAIVGWGIFSTTQLIPRFFLNTGSLADWLAALGTWVIGSGAWILARENHLLHSRQANEAKEKEMIKTIASLELLVGKVSSLLRPNATIETLLKTSYAERRELTVQFIEEILEELDAIEWTEADRALLALAPNMTHHFQQCETQRRLFVGTASGLVKQARDVRYGLDVAVDLRLRSLSAIAKATSKDAVEFTHVLLDEAARVRTQVTKLTGRK